MPSRWTLALILTLGLVVSAVLFATTLVLLDPFAYGKPVTWGMPFMLNLCFLAVWVAMAPLVVRLARRLPMGGNGWRRALPLQFLLSVLLSLLHLAIVELVVLALNVRRPGGFGELTFWRTVGFSVAANLQASMALYWTLAGLAYAREYYKSFQEQAVRASQQTAELARARLQVLETQLAPHFLFNTLNSISSLVDHDTAAARRMIARLGDLLRYSLRSQEQAEVSLEEEALITTRYLEIERARYGERLHVVTRITPEAACCNVPALLLQPLVENCVRHGVTRSLAPVRLEISANLTDDQLNIEVRDDGPGADGGHLRAGVGLANVRARLAHLYGDAQSFAIQTEPGRGFAVRMLLPARSAGVEEVA